VPVRSLRINEKRGPELDTAYSTGGILSLRDLAYFVFKRKNQILLVFLVTLVMSILGSYVAPRQYEAYSTVYVVRNLPPIAAVSQSSYSMLLERKEVLNSEVDLIKSRAVAGKVADRLAAEDASASEQVVNREPSGPVALIRSMREGFQGLLVWLGLNDPAAGGREGLIEAIQAKIQARTSLNSNIITISYRGPDGAYGARVVNAATTVYLEERLGLMKRPGLEDFYEQHIERSQKTLETLEAEARRLKAETGIVAVDEEIRLKLQELSSRKTDLNQVRSEAQELRERIAAFREQTEDQPQTITASRTVGRNPAISELERKRLELQVEKASELNRFSSGSRPIEDLDESIKRIDEAIREEEPTIVTSESLAANVIRVELESELFRSEADYTAKLAREAVLVAQIAALERQLHAIDNHAAELNRISQALANAERVHQTYLDQKEEARIADKTDPGTTNVMVVDYAEKPSRPVHSRSTLISFGALAGLCLAFALAFVSELMDQGLSTRDDIERHLRLPLLASLPESKTVASPLALESLESRG
jgi:uncharacterized protein involved in exopolysaccharide biosynthesis